MCLGTLRKVTIMKKLNRSFLNIMLVAVLAFAFNIVALAQGTTSISVSKNSAQVGDSISVTASGSENGSITVKYTSSMLQFMDCNVSGYKSEGNAITFSGKEGTIKFKAIADGTASVIVSSSANSGSSTTLTIGGSAPAAPAPTEEAPAQEAPEEAAQAEEATAEETAAPAPAPAAAGTGTLNASGGFDIGGVAYVVSERYSDSEMPAGFSKTTITIGSSTYSEPTNGTLTLLYLKPADNTAGSGVFYLYNADAGTVSPFLMLGTSKSYVILATPDAPLSASLTETTIEVTGGTATAYTMDGAEFFYVYGANQDGAVGWFLYDKTYNTVSRVDASAFSAGQANTSEEAPAAETVDTSLYIEKLNLYRKIIMGLIVLCVILLFIIINRAIKGNNEDDDDFDGDVFANAPKRASKKLPRSIVFKHNGYEEEEEDSDGEYDDDEEYDEDDEYEDDEDLEEEEEYYQSESYETRRASSLNMMDLNDL